MRIIMNYSWSWSLGYGFLYGCAFLPPLPGRWQVVSFLLRVTAFLVGFVGWIREQDQQISARTAAISGFLFAFGFTWSTLWGAFPAFWVVRQSAWFLPCLGGVASLWGTLLGALCWTLHRLLSRIPLQETTQAFPYFPLGFSLCWTLFEWGRSYIPLAFPWNLTTHIFAFEDLGLSLALLQVVRPFGVYFLSALLSLVSSSLVARTPRCLKILSSFLMVGVLAYGGYQLCLPTARLGKSVKVLVVQPNTPQIEKLNRQNAEALLGELIAQTQQALEAQSTLPDVVIWPETAVTYYLHKALPPALYSQLPLDKLTLIFGADRIESVEPQEELVWHNGLFFVSPSSRGKSVTLYDKQRLLPFGEYVPFRKFLPKSGIFKGIDCTPGTLKEVVSISGLPDVCVKICSEGMFPWRKGGAHWGIQVLNDGWFARPLLWQHLAVDRVRVVEVGIPVIRVGNTGVTAHIDSNGKIRKMLASCVREVDVFEVE